MFRRRIVNIRDRSRWAVILAGGEGARVRSLTRLISGDERPKQFCTVLGNETLLEQTAHRVSRVVRPSRTRVVLTRPHERFFDSRTIDMATSVITQPANRGTAPAIVYSLLSICNEDSGAQVALLPADHYCQDDVAFIRHVDLAFQAVARQPDLVILLGVVPTSPEVDYGWIEPGEPVRGILGGALLGGALLRVRRFWEKPSLEVAKELLERGCLWNSFVIVGSVRNLLDLVKSALPVLYSLFETVQPMIGTPAEGPVLNELYGRLSAVDFSGEVLRTRPEALSVLPVEDASWTDMGSVDRVRSVMASCGRG